MFPPVGLCAVGFVESPLRTTAEADRVGSGADLGGGAVNETAGTGLLAAACASTCAIRSRSRAFIALRAIAVAAAATATTITAADPMTPRRRHIGRWAVTPG